MTDEAKALVERLREVGRDGVWKSGRNPTTAHPMCIKAADLIETQAREIARLREALQFYAREYNWKSCGVYMCGHSNPSSAEIDRGNKARAALAGDSHE